MSSTDVKIFEKEEFGSVRVVMQGDDPWFVASDVAKSLGYDNPANAINTHCKKINKITLSPDLGGREISSKMPPVVMNIIPESDVYRLVMRSNLPNAVAFQDWVCEEVLPAIRKTGEYSTTLPDFTNPAEAARAWADEYEKNLALTAANQQLTEEKEMLEIVIGNAREWKAVTAIPWLKHYFIDTSPRTCAAIGKFLASCSRMRGAEIKKSPDSRWGEVNVYRTDIIDDMELAEVFGKEHYNVLRDIRETVAKCSKSFCALNFEGAEYLDEQGKSRPMYLMTKDGFTMVAMAYTTPEAMRFKEAYIAEFNRMEAELQRGTQQSLPEFPAKIEAAAIILRVAGITGNQAALSLDKVYRREAGYSFLETVEVALEAPTKRQILNPTELGKALGGLSPRAVNSVLAAMNFQTKIMNGKWEPIGTGTAYAVMLDTGKLHSDGTPIRQLKWDTGVIPVIQNFLDAEIED